MATNVGNFHGPKNILAKILFCSLLKQVCFTSDFSFYCLSPSIDVRLGSIEGCFPVLYPSLPPTHSGHQIPLLALLTDLNRLAGKCIVTSPAPTSKNGCLEPFRVCVQHCNELASLAKFPRCLLFTLFLSFGLFLSHTSLETCSNFSHSL